jgi:hypothetical protein
MPQRTLSVPQRKSDGDESVLRLEIQEGSPEKRRCNTRRGNSDGPKLANTLESAMTPEEIRRLRRCVSLYTEILIPNLVRELVVEHASLLGSRSASF